MKIGLQVSHEFVADRENNIPVTRSVDIKHNGRWLNDVLNSTPTLDEEGKIPSSQLPSYVDDVLEYDVKAGFPAKGERGKIYVDLSTNRTYRWGGTMYVEISESLALGETSSTAYAGSKGKKNADDIKALQETKVDKIQGMGLSQNDYSNTEKAKVKNAQEEIERLSGYFKPVFID